MSIFAGQMEQIALKTYNHYGSYLRRQYKGAKVFKVIVDGHFTCPNRDGSKGYGGCTYCNVDSFTPHLARNQPSIEEQVKKGIDRAKANYGAEKFIIYFQPNTNTYAPVDYLEGLYDQALQAAEKEQVVGLSIGTRPDCIDAQKIALLEKYVYEKGLTVDLELGMESIHENTLLRINRGCSHAEFVAALELLEPSSLQVCVHTIFGLPEESESDMLAYATEINRFAQIKFVKLHHLHIVKGSIMGANYAKEPFKLFEMDEYLEFLCQFIPRLRPDIVIQRLFGIADRSLLIAPNWELNKSAIQQHFEKTFVKQRIVQGSLL